MSKPSFPVASNPTSTTAASLPASSEGHQQKASPGLADASTPASSTSGYFAASTALGSIYGVSATTSRRAHSPTPGHGSPNGSLKTSQTTAKAGGSSSLISARTSTESLKKQHGSSWKVIFEPELAEDDKAKKKPANARVIRYNGILKPDEGPSIIHPPTDPRPGTFNYHTLGRARKRLTHNLLEVNYGIRIHRSLLDAPPRPPPTRHIFVSGLPVATTTEDLHTYFGIFGDIGMAINEVHPHTAQNVGLASVSYAGDELSAGTAATAAVEQMSGRLMEGRSIRVELDPDGSKKRTAIDHLLRPSAPSTAYPGPSPPSIPYGYPPPPFQPHSAPRPPPLPSFHPPQFARYPHHQQSSGYHSGPSPYGPYPERPPPQSYRSGPPPQQLQDRRASYERTAALAGSPSVHPDPIMFPPVSHPSYSSKPSLRVPHHAAAVRPHRNLLVVNLLPMFGHSIAAAVLHLGSGRALVDCIRVHHLAVIVPGLAETGPSLTCHCDPHRAAIGPYRRKAGLYPTNLRVRRLATAALPPVWAKASLLKNLLQVLQGNLACKVQQKTGLENSQYESPLLLRFNLFNQSKYNFWKAIQKRAKLTSILFGGRPTAQADRGLSIEAGVLLVETERFLCARPLIHTDLRMFPRSRHGGRWRAHHGQGPIPGGLAILSSRVRWRTLTGRGMSVLLALSWTRTVRLNRRDAQPILQVKDLSYPSKCLLRKSQCEFSVEIPQSVWPSTPQTASRGGHKHRRSGPGQAQIVEPSKSTRAFACATAFSKQERKVVSGRTDKYLLYQAATHPTKFSPQKASGEAAYLSPSNRQVLPVDHKRFTQREGPLRDVESPQKPTGHPTTPHIFGEHTLPKAQSATTPETLPQTVKDVPVGNNPDSPEAEPLDTRSILATMHIGRRNPDGSVEAKTPKDAAMKKRARTFDASSSDDDTVERHSQVKSRGKATRKRTLKRRRAVESAEESDGLSEHDDLATSKPVIDRKAPLSSTIVEDVKLNVPAARKTVKEKPLKTEGPPKTIQEDAKPIVKPPPAKVRAKKAAIATPVAVTVPTTKKRKAPIKKPSHAVAILPHIPTAPSPILLDSDTDDDISFARHSTFIWPPEDWANSPDSDASLDLDLEDSTCLLRRRIDAMDPEDVAFLLQTLYTEQHRRRATRAARFQRRLRAEADLRRPCPSKEAISVMRIDSISRPPSPLRVPPSIHKSGAARTEPVYRLSYTEKAAAAKARLDLTPVAATDTTPTTLATTVPDRPIAIITHRPIHSDTRIRSKPRAHGMHSRLTTSQENQSDSLQFHSLNARHSSLRFGRSPIHDWGLFATILIPALEFVIEYIGEIVREKVADTRERRYERRGIDSSYLFRIDAENIVDATFKGNMARFINHNCEPNCSAKIITVAGRRRIVIYANRDIQAGEEITYDYQFPLEEEKIPCLCGAAACRGTLN
ncbi:Histone-lysine N-methyltransferase setd1a [Thoreauomyces humboldtii]|nr:Histone-lysine N-methyltransferase setd1a [Thoreauomyces humboldtii]